MSLNPKITAWQGQRVWVVGASSGIGAALACSLHALGADVTISARRGLALHALALEHPGLHVLTLDATDPQAVSDAAQALQAQQGLDLVCYCAGHFQAQSAAELDWAEWERHRRVNLDGAVMLALAVLPDMRRRRHGHLSLISSVAGFRGLPRSLAYGSTKAALTHLAEALHLELVPAGVGVSVVTPGFVDTPMTATNDFPMPALISSEEAAQAILSGWARGRFMIDFPRRLTLPMRLLRCLPGGLYFPLIRRITMR